MKMNFTRHLTSLFAMTFWAMLWTALPFANPAHAISETGFVANMATEVMPFYAKGVQGFFAGKEGVPISYLKFENSNEIGAIVIVSGRIESYAMYAETIYDLAQQGFSIYIYDHRGQGFSGRMLPDPQKDHIDDFQYLVDDLKTFVNTVVNSKPHAKRYLLAHSMGGAVAANYGLQYPQDFDAYAMTSPMMRINTSPYPYLLAHLIVDVEILAGNLKNYSLGQKPFNPAETFAANVVTTSELRWNVRHANLIDNPTIQLGGATNGWLRESFKGGENAIASAAAFQPRVLVIEAGNDQVVEISGENAFCNNAQHCEKTLPYIDADHELLRERDSIRNDVMAKIEAFFGAN